MALANCKKCGRLFNQGLRDVCPVCVKEEDEQFFIVRNYLKEHRNASTYEVSEATEVEVTLIVKFIREGRLTTVDNPNLHYPCESCGEPTVEGRFCKSCKDRLNREFAQTKSDLRMTNDPNNRATYFHKRDR